MNVAYEEFEVEADGPRLIVRPMLTTDQAVDLFLGDLTRRGYSKRTIDTYRRILDKLCDRLPDDLDVAKITADDCRRFLDGWSSKAAGTRAHTYSVVSSFFGWLYKTEKIKRSPLERIDRPRRLAAEDLDVTTVSSADVRALLKAAKAKGWSHTLAIAIVAYMGPRRRAAALLRLSDYDREGQRIRFREKGNKTIWKPVPAELAGLIESAMADGAIVEQTDYLIPSGGPLSRKGDRDDRIVWRLVKDVAKTAGVKAHVHSLRAAFAVFYLEQNPGNIESLKELMGHRSLATTQIYLRKLNRGSAMEPVRGLSWGAEPGNEEAARSSQFAENRLASSSAMGAGGFEPPFADSDATERPGTQHPESEEL